MSRRSISELERLALGVVLDGQETLFPVSKEGRVLSGRNLKLVNDAIAALQALADAGARPEPAQGAALIQAPQKSLLPVVTTDGPGFPVVKSDEEMRYTLGPMYAPDRLDAHGEFVTDDDLHRATIGYMQKSDRRLRMMHDETVECGTVVEMVRWPLPVTVTVKAKDGTGEKHMDLPAGTVYTGVVWDESAWPLIKSGEIRGLSLGGKALRLRASTAGPTAHVFEPEG